MECNNKAIRELKIYIYTINAQLLQIWKFIEFLHLSCIVHNTLTMFKHFCAATINDGIQNSQYKIVKNIFLVDFTSYK